MHAARGHQRRGGTEVVEDTITFSFPASTTISVDSELPAVTADITIDATTVTGYASGSRVVLDGTELAAGDGLHLAGDNGKVTGLVVNDFPNVGILVNGSGAVLDELRVGTDEVGAMDEGNGATASRVVGQPVGTSVEITDSLISETAATASGSTAITSRSARACLEQHDGMNATGTAPIPNDGAGVSIEALTGNASSNVIGGTSAGEVPDRGNTGPGVRLYEGESGSADANRILGTSIHSNGGLGIDLTTDADPSGVTPNDAGDGDSGPNNLQNFLVIDTAETTGLQIHITGTLNSTPSTLGYRVEYFHSAACDGTNGEGEVFIGSQTANTDAGGAGGVDGTFVVAVPAGPRDHGDGDRPGRQHVGSPPARSPPRRRRRPDLHRQHDGLRRRRRRLQRGGLHDPRGDHRRERDAGYRHDRLRHPGRGAVRDRDAGHPLGDGAGRDRRHDPARLPGTPLVALDGQSDNLLGFQISAGDSTIRACDVRVQRGRHRDRER